MALIHQTIPFFNEFFQYWTKSLLACVCALLLLSLTSIATAAYTQFSTENWRRTEYHAGLQLSLSWELRLPCSAFAWLSPPFLSYFQFLLQGRRTVPLGRLLTINALVRSTYLWNFKIHLHLLLLKKKRKKEKKKEKKKKKWIWEKIPY